MYACGILQGLPVGVEVLILLLLREAPGHGLRELLFCCLIYIYMYIYIYTYTHMLICV